METLNLGAPLNYISSEGKTYKIVLNKLNKDSTVNSTSNTDAGEIQKINLNSGTGYLTVVKNDLVNLDFMLGDVVIIIIGDLPKEEVIKIANSIK
ncbi:DUF4367 domain-containing protein [Paenibacillus sp. RC67]|uniref:DUF4367 domain-containing protein n=1 Tax=Paenibacillus sp. RC67 TaxID=3039392 RepID=UPI0024AE4D46|nr:DUF4367 domain-containing protein [Paenibacillus sp. RC67]